MPKTGITIGIVAIVIIIIAGAIFLLQQKPTQTVVANNVKTTTSTSISTVITTSKITTTIPQNKTNLNSSYLTKGQVENLTGITFNNVSFSFGTNNAFSYNVISIRNYTTYTVTNGNATTSNVIDGALFNISTTYQLQFGPNINGCGFGSGANVITNFKDLNISDISNVVIVALERGQESEGYCYAGNTNLYLTQTTLLVGNGSADYNKLVDELSKVQHIQGVPGYKYGVNYTAIGSTYFVAVKGNELTLINVDTTPYIGGFGGSPVIINNTELNTTQIVYTILKDM